MQIIAEVAVNSVAVMLCFTDVVVNFLNVVNASVFTNNNNNNYSYYCCSFIVFVIDSNNVGDDEQQCSLNIQHKFDPNKVFGLLLLLLLTNRFGHK